MVYGRAFMLKSYDSTLAFRRKEFGIIRARPFFPICFCLLFCFFPSRRFGITQHSFFLVDVIGVMDTSVEFLADEKGRTERHRFNDFYRMPNMDRLARQGIWFRQFYANSVCSPSRGSLMTGQTSARHRSGRDNASGLATGRELPDDPFG